MVNGSLLAKVFATRGTDGSFKLPAGFACSPVEAISVQGVGGHLNPQGWSWVRGGR